MPLRLRNLVSKLELPSDDWVLSRFGGNEPPAAVAAGEEEGEEPKDSQRRASAGAQPFNNGVAQVPADGSAQAPQSGARVSLNASSDDSSQKPDRESRAS